MVSREWARHYFRYSVISQVDAHIKKDFPNARSMMDIQNDVSFVILNQHPTTVWPRPLPPNVIAIRSLHLRPAQPLPQASSRTLICHQFNLNYQKCAFQIMFYSVKIFINIYKCFNNCNTFVIRIYKFSLMIPRMDSYCSPWARTCNHTKCRSVCLTLS